MQVKRSLETTQQPSVQKIVKASLGVAFLIAVTISIFGALLSAFIEFSAHRKSIDKEIVEKISDHASDLVTAHTFNNLDSIQYQLSYLFKPYKFSCFQFVSAKDQILLIPGLQGCQSVEGSHKIEIASGGLEIGRITYTYDKAIFYDFAVREALVVLPLLLMAIILTWLPILRSVSRYLVEPITELANEVGSVAKSPMTAYPVNEIERLRERILEAQVTLKENVKLTVMAEICTQVAHDIRSPLTALKMVERHLHPLPEDARILVRSAVARIQDIANHLLEKNRRLQTNSVTALTACDEQSTILLCALLESIITEKRLQIRSQKSIRIEFDPPAELYALFVHLQPNEFKRVISNLINNSIEAVGDHGSITLQLERLEDTIKIHIRDTGCGIPLDKLEKLGCRGYTYGKEHGNGLGLYHAKMTMRALHGDLTIQSVVDVGTSVSLHLPAAKKPSWFTDRIEVKPNSTIVVLDDDQSIHTIWKGRFASARLHEHGVTVMNFTVPADFALWVDSRHSTEDVKFLIDYELIGSTQTGLSLIEKLDIPNQSVLVTSRYEEPNIISRCEKLGVPILPKSMAVLIPISATNLSIEVQRPDHSELSI
jgi:signal transduction histidine kinase